MQALELCMKKVTFWHLLNMKHILQIIQLSIFVILSSGSFAQRTTAKRAAPKEVTPVVSGQIKYTAPNYHNMGDIVAIDIATNKVLWTKKIYTTKYNPILEQDVQDVFIDSIYLKKNKLYIRNERGRTYAMDIKTLEVKKIFRIL